MNLMWFTVPPGNVPLHVMRTLGMCILHIGDTAPMRGTGSPARLLVVAMAAFAAAAVSPVGPASAAPGFITLGQVAPTVDSLGGGGCALLCNAVQFASVTSPNPGYDIPYDGVITRWSVKTGSTVNSAPEWARPRTFRPTSATTATLISQGAQGSLTTPSEQPMFWDRIPATAGDVLGAQFHSGALISETVPTYIDNTAAGDVAARNYESPGPDIGGTTTGPGYANQRVNISAHLEHDSDHDGYGDGSQDLCTGDATHATTACSGALFGSDLQGPYQRVGYTCSGIGYACVRVQLTTAAGTSTAARTDGVVVRWRLQGPGAGDYRIRILDPATGGGYTFARSSDPVTVGADEALQTFAARLPIAAGGYVALTPPFSVPEATLITPPAGSRFTTLSEPPADGTAATIAGSLPGVFLYDADIEPDADHDGYGDVTQDACPADATTHGACPPASAAPGTGGAATTPGGTLVTTAAAGKITALQLRYPRFRILRRGAVIAGRPHAGTALLVTLSAPARVRFTVRRLAGGVRRGGSCRPPTAGTRKLRRCTRAVLVHAFTRALAAGATSTAYSGRYQSAGRTRTLSRGRFRLEAAVLSAAGRAGAVTTRSFAVVR